MPGTGRRATGRRAVLLALSATLVGCASSEQGTSPGADGTSAAPSPPTSSASGSVDPSLAGVVDQARADLAARLGVAGSSLTVVSAEVVTWPDAGLGCRKPGMVYAQVVTDGSRTVLEHDGTRYDYHTGGRTAVPFLCEHPG